MNVSGRFAQNFRNILGQIRSECGVKDARENEVKTSQPCNMDGRNLVTRNFVTSLQPDLRCFEGFNLNLLQISLRYLKRFRRYRKKMKGGKNVLPPTFGRLRDNPPQPKWRGSSVGLKFNFWTVLTKWILSLWDEITLAYLLLLINLSPMAIIKEKKDSAS